MFIFVIKCPHFYLIGYFVMFIFKLFTVGHDATQSPTNSSLHQSHQHLFQHQTSVTSSASVQTVLHQSVYNMSSSQFNDNSSTSSFPIQNNVNSSGSTSSLMTNNSLQQHNHLSMASNLSIVEAGLSIGDVADLLHPQYAIITGGRSREGCSLITFPDHNNFHTLGDNDYKKLILYLTSVPAYVDYIHLELQILFLIKIFSLQTP